jgi:ketosteroid isomerase-like protein
MGIEENKALVRRFVDAQNRGNVEDMLACWAPDSVNHAGRIQDVPRPASVAPGLEDIRSVFESLQTAFPDRRMEITDVIGEGDRVVCRMTVSGTHQGVPAAPVEGGSQTPAHPAQRPILSGSAHSHLPDRGRQAGRTLGNSR